MYLRFVMQFLSEFDVVFKERDVLAKGSLPRGANACLLG